MRQPASGGLLRPLLCLLLCGDGLPYSYHYHAANIDRPDDSGAEDSVTRRIGSAEELWRGAQQLWETHGPLSAWPVAFEATKLDPLDPASLFNAAVLREQYDRVEADVARRRSPGKQKVRRKQEQVNKSHSGHGNTLPTQIALLKRAHALAWKFDLRLKAAWNLASLLEKEHSRDQTMRSRKAALDAWWDVLDVPIVPAGMKEEALAKIEQLRRRRGAEDGNPSADDSGSIDRAAAPTNNLNRNIAAKLSTLNRLLSIMRDVDPDISNSSTASSHTHSQLETMDMATLDAVGELLSCIAYGPHSAQSTTESIAEAISYCCDSPTLSSSIDKGRDIRAKESFSMTKRLESLTGFINAVRASIVRPRARRSIKMRRPRPQLQHTCEASNGVSSCGNSSALMSSPNVVVVGAGPSGLTTALTAFRDGAASVSVFEKRSNAPSRQHWFDADPKTMQVLSEWGLGRFVHVPMQLETTMPGYATFQCHMLERFLALVVYASSSTYPGADEILVRRGIAFERFADNTIEEEDIVPSGSPSIALFRRSFVDTAHNPDALQAVPFDVIFACDGANSAVRNAAGVIAELQGTFLPFREEIGLRRDEKSIRQKQERGVRRLAQLKGTFRRTQSQSVDVESRAQEAQGLSQTTLILAFEKETRNGSLACPAYHKHMDAFAPAVADASGGITAVFKRLHSPFCEFQVLLSHKLMASLRVSGESRVPIGRIFVDQDFFPWENVLAAADLLFVRPFGSVESLRRALRPYAYHKAGDQDDQYNGSSVRATATPPRHAVLFRMGIHRASRSALVHGDGSIVVIRGDAVLSAHYRLGIGINQAFESLENEVAGIVLQWHRLFELAAAEVDQPRTRLSVLEELAERHRLRADPRVTWMSDVQLFTMFFEAYCDLIVDNSDLNDLVVLRKVRSTPGAKVAAHVSAEPLSDADVQHLPCMVQWLNFSRNNAP